jgi:hypothetical protein
MLSEIEGEDGDFSYLKGYEKGPVFSDVYGDYTYRREEFIKGADEAYDFNPEIVDPNRAEFSSFLIEILNEEELSDLTHELDIWKAKEDKINSGERQVQLDGSDLSREDMSLISLLRDTYTEDYINSVRVIQIGQKNFLINIEDIPKLTTEQENALIDLSINNELDNPVYITISDEGVLLLD